MILKFDMNFGISTTTCCTGIIGKDNMSGRLTVWGREGFLLGMDHKLRVSVWCNYV